MNPLTMEAEIIYYRQSTGTFAFTPAWTTDKPYLRLGNPDDTKRALAAINNHDELVRLLAEAVSIIDSEYPESDPRHGTAVQANLLLAKLNTP